jgi:putative hydrolase of the HAD superfamily
MQRSTMPSKRITAVLFDAGFTLVDLVTPVVEAYLGAARNVGAEIDASEFGRTLKRHWARLEDDHRKRNPDLTSSEEFERSAWRNFTGGIAADFPSLHDRHGDWHGLLVKHFDDPSAWKPAPFVLEVLRSLKARGIRMGVVSNWHSALHPILDAHGVKAMFDFVLTSAEAGRKKPHREIFELALSRLGARADETAHVGDSWSDDVCGALESGLTPIYLHRVETQPPVNPRVHVVRSLAEIPKLVEGN